MRLVEGLITPVRKALSGCRLPGLDRSSPVTADGTGVVAHAGTRLLADFADATGLIQAFSDALAGLRRRDTGHDPGRVAVDVAVMLAHSGQRISDLAVLRQQPAVFGPVASTPTAWRVLAGTGETHLAALRAARAQARELAWAQATETGRAIPAARAAGRDIQVWSSTWTPAW